ncbi:hypothetical protein F4777DRAFT_91116 [Nemania sp. FL0916]|nr:hypothetical protein F4777DRAFT_91116 [Nemania sp. FL0916]
MGSQYYNTPAYQWYLRGDADGLRPPRMPAFKTDHEGRIALAVGELFCRVSEDDGNTLCRDRRKFSSVAALKRHIREAHQLEPVKGISGRMTNREDELTAQYWKDIYDVSNGFAAEREPDPPRRAGNLIPIPFNIASDGTKIPDIIAMKANVRLAADGQCTSCAT